MARVTLAALLYFLIVFAAGFALGAIRIPLLAPWIGALAATLVELPVMLAAAWLASGWLMRRLMVRSTGGALLMGGGAFALLMLAEPAGAMLLFGQSLADYAAALFRPAGAIGLAGQAVFGAIPVIRLMLGRAPSPTVPDDTAHGKD